MTYYQELDFDHDWATYVYPLATTAQAQHRPRTTGRFALTVDVKIAVPVVGLKSPSHADQFALVRHADDHYWQASLETSGGDLSRDVVLAFQTQRPHTGLDLIAERAGNEEGYFQLTFTAGQELHNRPTGRRLRVLARCLRQHAA